MTLLLQCDAYAGSGVCGDVLFGEIRVDLSTSYNSYNVSWLRLKLKHPSDRSATHIYIGMDTKCVSSTLICFEGAYGSTLLTLTVVCLRRRFSRVDVLYIDIYLKP